MANCRILITNLCKQYSKLSLQNYYHSCNKNVFQYSNLLQSHAQPVSISWRYTHAFFSRTNAEQLWKGVTSVSNAGRKKGRGRTRKKARDLNKGQVLGVGKINMLWPGLNAPIIQGREVLRQQQLPPDENREKRLIELRDKLAVKRKFKIHPLERGWSGTKLGGRSLGPPDPVGEETFEGFDSRCLKFRTVSHMTAQRGRVRRYQCLAIVGNKNGLAGFALGRSMIGTSAAKAAKNKAAKLLRYINLDGNTVIHDFYSEYGATRVFVERRPEGFGLHCHRVIKAICEIIGIKDLYAKAEGSKTNTLALTRAFFIGLMNQKSLKEIANEKQLHIVKLENNRDNFPVVVASPDKCRTEKEIEPTELLDYSYYLHKGKTVEAHKEYEPWYWQLPSYKKKMKDTEKLRNERSVRIQLLAKYGALKSFVQVREEEKEKQQLKETVEATE